MAAMIARQQFDDGGGFAMPPNAEHDAFVGPFHRSDSTPDSTVGEFQPHLAIALRIVAPAFAHLDEQEQMHRRADDIDQFAARLRADILDRLAALAQHDLALALALDIDRLLD